MTGRASSSSMLRHLLLGLLVLGTLAMHHLSSVGHAHNADGEHQHPAITWHAGQHGLPEHPARTDAASADCCHADTAAEQASPAAGPESDRHGDKNALWHLCLAVLALAAALRFLIPRARRLHAALDVAHQATWLRATLTRPLPPLLATRLTSVAVLRL